MSLTRAGKILLTIIPVVALSSWLFGQPELTLLAVAGAALLFVAFVRVRFIPLRVEVRRNVRPARLHVDEPCQIVLRVRNRSRVRSPVLQLTDDVGRFGEATLKLAPLAPGATRDASYVFPTRRRGVHHIGPLVIEIEDGFGLVRSKLTSPRVDSVIILPRVHHLDPIPPAPGDEPEQGIRTLTSNSTVDEDFAALRPYQPGDDIRRIHWRTTAKQGHPVVRQFDQPWQHRTTVLLDVRRGAHDEESFERAVSAAASVLQLSADRVELVRLVTTAGRDSGFVPANERVDGLLDQLAEVLPDSRGTMSGTVASLSQRATGRLVSCVGSLESSEYAGLVRASRRFGLHVMVVAGRVDAVDTPGGPVRVSYDSSTGLTAAWSTASRTLGRIRLTPAQQAFVSAKSES